VMPDRISVRAIRTDVPMEQTVKWTDPEPGKPDDYYYARVVQTDGGMAWTSPVWVGGFSRQTQ